MSHVNYPRSLPGSFMLAELTSDLIKVKGTLARLRAYMDAITDNGATLTAMEAPADAVNFGVPAGSAQNIYGAMILFQQSLDNIPASVLAQIDLGG